MTAELAIPVDGPVDGVLVAHGSHAGGYVAYIRQRRLHYAYNFVGTEITIVAADVELSPGAVTGRVVFTRSGRGGEVALFYDDLPVGVGTVPRTTPVTYGTPCFAVGYLPSGPVIPDFEGRAAIPDGVLRRMVIEAEGVDPLRERIDSTRADLATQ
jgi:hypothetical protein